MSPERSSAIAAVTAALLLLTMAATAEAAVARRFAIPAQPLETALVQFSLATGEQVIADPRLLQNRRASPVRGTMTSDSALATLLSEAGLTARRSGPAGVFLIETAPTSFPPPDVALPVVLSPVTVSAAPQEAVTAAATTVHSGGSLRRLGVYAPADLARLIPGLTVSGASAASMGFSMRGVTQASGDATREPRLSVFLDGLSASKERGASFELFDLEAVEVVEGPQPTRFGRGALTGAINIVQNKARPGEDAGAALEVRAGHEAWIADATGDLPLGETIALRVAGRLRRDDGTVRNLLGGGELDTTRTEALRTSLAWAPDEGARLDLILNYERNRPTGAAMKSLILAPADPLTGALLGDLDPATPPALNDTAALPLGLDRTLLSASLAGRREMGPLTLTGLVGVRRFYADEGQDGDATGLPVVHVLEKTRGLQHSLDLRLGLDGGPVSGFIGLSVLRETGTQLATFTIGEPLLLARLTGRLLDAGPQSQAQLEAHAALLDDLRTLGGATPAALDALIGRLKSSHRERNQNFSRSFAADIYGELAWRPSPAWALSLGARVSHEDKTSAVRADLPDGGSILAAALAAAANPGGLDRLAATAAVGEDASLGLLFQPTAGDGAPQAGKLDDSGVSWRLAAEYRPRRDLAWSLTLAQGRRPSVLVAGAPARPYGTARFGVAPAERIESAEAGFAYRPHPRVGLAGAAYGYRYRDFQTTRFVDGHLRTLNAGEAHAVGLEARGDLALGRGVRLFGAYGYNRSRMTVGAYEGNAFRLAPDHKLSLGAEFEQEAFGGLLQGGALYSWQSRQFFADDNDRPELTRGLAPDLVQDEVQQSYGLLNLHLAWTAPQGAWSLGAYVTNALDTHYMREGGFIGELFGFSAAAPGLGRRAGVSLRIVR